MIPRTPAAILAALLLASPLIAQLPGLEFDPESVTLETRHKWCVSQTAACVSICKSKTTQNECNDADLSFNCECKNYPAPNMLDYENTLPTLVCTNMYLNCINNSESNDQTARAKCWTDIGSFCGTQDPAIIKPPKTTSKGVKPTSVASSDTTSVTSTTSSDQDTTLKTFSTTTASLLTLKGTSSGQVTASGTSMAIETLTTPSASISTPAVTGTPLAAQNTTAAAPAGEPKKSMTKGQLAGMVVGIIAGLSILILIILGNRAQAKKRRITEEKEEREREEALEAEQRSIRSKRHEMSADALRQHLVRHEIQEDVGSERSEMLSGDTIGSPTCPAELPTQFYRPHSRIYEVE
ncbi:hypothetical protein VTL71DRAFT_15363 [Oculimacula yallundae]|uniref:DUF7707 domain-containing protein n=1 Tax=Oculimacula yallundae TaxID=86028 RepID=A0ABR4CGZ6_9HELO